MIRRGRGYVVLRKLGEDDDNVYQQITAVVAISRKHAINIATSEGPYQHGRFRAVRSSDWALEVTK